MPRLIETTPIDSFAAGKRTLKQRVFVVCYLIAVSIATLGWLSTIGWAAAEVASLI